MLAALLAAAVPAVGGDTKKAVEAAADGAALQALLDRTPAARDAVAQRAAGLGLAVLDIRVGAGERAKPEVRVAGGGKPFTDCDAPCPPMVVVPASPAGFQIGSPEDEADRSDDETQTAVTLPAFAVGTRPVTVAEYKACVAAGGCEPPEWLEPDGRHNIETGTSRYYRNLGEGVTGSDQPIVGVSHIDATAYAKWLSSRTGHAYRLPSEAEWEFAARAGTKTAFWWGNDAPAGGDPAKAACQGCGSAWDMTSPAPPDAFPANPWGLRNVHGSAWEWTADLYCEDLSRRPRDGTPRLVDDCEAVGNRAPARGVYSLRGGSSFFPAKTMRAAMRVRNVPDFRNFSVGFRIARAIVP